MRIRVCAPHATYGYPNAAAALQASVLLPQCCAEVEVRVFSDVPTHLVAAAAAPGDRIVVPSLPQCIALIHILLEASQRPRGGGGGARTATPGHVRGAIRICISCVSCGLPIRHVQTAMRHVTECRCLCCWRRSWARYRVSTARPPPPRSAAASPASCSGGGRHLRAGMMGECISLWAAGLWRQRRVRPRPATPRLATRRASPRGSWRCCQRWSTRTRGCGRACSRSGRAPSRCRRCPPTCRRSWSSCSPRKSRCRSWVRCRGILIWISECEGPRARARMGTHRLPPPRTTCRAARDPPCAALWT